jgi:hypothetical protein
MMVLPLFETIRPFSQADKALLLIYGRFAPSFFV